MQQRGWQCARPCAAEAATPRATWSTPFSKMKKKVRFIRPPPTQNVSLTRLGPSHGCIGEREDLHALPHLVRSAPSLDARHQSCAVERINYPLSSSNNPASLTSRLGATIDVEQNHVRFLGDLILNLWDCGGQDAFMDSYLSTQRSTIFQHVGVLIYVFEVSTHDAAKDAAYYRDCLDALQKYSPEAGVFLLVHKMDLVTGDRAALLERRTRELQAESGAVTITVFGTSIHDETLYKVRLPPMLSRARFIFSLPPHSACLD